MAWRTNFEETNKSITVAIIDDDELHTALITRQLKRAEMDVKFYAQNGMCGIAALQSMLTLPEVVIVDIEMPVMSGFEVVKYLRQAWPYLPIIAYSSLTSAEVHQRIMADGANMFILKQPVASKLISAIKILSAVKN
ncbi:two-component system secretion response regulator SsrB [Mucilaginibacter oryzae]|uniref:Two-component system secretion response regulator SsrB n=1 Tax=Mucilaginibacter oryzae TaxID=468058 RepID=A0A316HAL9_9SPHI|nr:response regulator [Mucilaginibacter oryzae]PWK77516.1 two-component system secretion response regulator SsrB [Mucilaginibacter oryzae]